MSTRDTNPGKSLPEIVLKAARDQGLTIIGGEVLYELNIGAGIFLQTWLTNQMSAIRIEVRGLFERSASDVNDGSNANSAFDATWSDPLSIEQSLALVSRWSELKKLKLNGD